MVIPWPEGLDNDDAALDVTKLKGRGRKWRREEG